MAINSTDAMENSIAAAQKIKNRTITQQLPKIHIQKIEIRVSKIYLYIPIHSSILHKSQNKEITQEFIDGQMDKQNMVHAHNGTLLSPYKEENSDILQHG